MQCNCENSMCEHMQKDEMCTNPATEGKNRIAYIGETCDDCFSKYPLEYVFSIEEVETQQSNTCSDTGNGILPQPNINDSWQS